jgi:hypothetical protein
MSTLLAGTPCARRLSVGIMKFNLTLAKVLHDLALKMQMVRRDFFFLY